MKPSTKIAEIAKEFASKGTDPGFYGYQPQLGDWISAILKYLDDNQ